MDLRNCLRIGVIGGSAPSSKWRDMAYRVGQLIAQNNAILICGGLGGVMQEAARGAKQAGGLTIGILPGNHVQEANEYIDIPIPTGLGHARNILVVNSADGIIAIDGSYGTLTEIAFCLLGKIPLVGMGTWKISHEDHSSLEITNYHAPEEAIEVLVSKINSIKKSKPQNIKNRG